MESEREEAVEILLCVADLYENTREGLEPEDVIMIRANPLAFEAWLEVSLDGTTMAKDALEAAALVRGGWNPGDPIPE